MKRTMWLLIPVLVVILLSGCMSNTEETVEYITPEELFEYIKTHDVGATVDDFEGIDMEVFIRSGGGFRVGNEINPQFDFKKAIDAYWWGLKKDEIDVYLAYEIKQVDCTDEEFEDFKNKFVDSIGEKEMVISPKESAVMHCAAFDIEFYDGNIYTVMIGQTKNLKDLKYVANGEKIRVVKGDRKNGKPAYVDLISTKYELVFIPSFYYSESEKYFSFFYNMDDPQVTIDTKYEITKLFHETG